MTKRPKLSISQPQGGVRKRPDGFRVPPRPPKKPVPSALRELPPKPASPSREQAAASKELQPQAATWLNARTIAKTLLVVGAAALSIYFLKRRLF